jgi:hypothetical protein
MVMVVSGCGRESDAVVIDFSKTVVVDRPISSEPESAQLKVAVAAIISPKETFAYYRQLLDYIGQKLGREIQFIQRKTYKSSLSSEKRMAKSMNYWQRAKLIWHLSVPDPMSSARKNTVSSCWLHRKFRIAISIIRI